MPVATHQQLINYQPVALGAWLVRTLRLWGSRRRERHSFSTIDERELRDFGLSRWEVERELAKPFWRG
jgi:uncharacterized protein YjiS (DUF1127 family)